jgi:hypothetical protein
LEDGAGACGGQVKVLRAIELWPDAAGNVPAWSAEDFALVKAAPAAWADLVRRRQDFDSAARTAAQPNTWPHA